MRGKGTRSPLLAPSFLGPLDKETSESRWSLQEYLMRRSWQDIAGNITALHVYLKILGTSLRCPAEFLGAKEASKKIIREKVHTSLRTYCPRASIEIPFTAATSGVITIAGLASKHSLELRSLQSLTLQSFRTIPP